MSKGETEMIGRRLEGLYRRYIGEPKSTREVYGGFGLFFGGILLIVAGVTVFLFSVVGPVPEANIWQYREIAITLASAGIPVFLFSFLILLPVDRRALLVASIGGIICLGGVGVFLFAYPYHWDVPGEDYSALGVLTYSVGGVLLAAATGSALVTNYIQQVEPKPAQGDVSGVSGESTEEVVTDEQVKQDIEEAVSSSELSWGGVEKRETTRLRINAEEGDFDPSGLEGLPGKERRSGSVDREVDGLKKLRGNETRMASGQGTDAEATALQELRDKPPETVEESTGYWDRITSLIRR